MKTDAKTSKSAYSSLYIDSDSPLGEREPHDPHQGTWRDGFVWFLVVVVLLCFGAVLLRRLGC